MFIIGHSRKRSGRTVFPVGGEYTTNISDTVKGADFRYDEGLRIRKNGTSPTLTANNKKMGMDNTDLSNSVYAVFTPYRIRKLTPLECWRLQGFTDEQFYKAKNSGVSYSQLYKQAGNSVTVNVINEISKRFEVE